MTAEGVEEPKRNDVLKCRSFGLRTENLAAPDVWRVDVAIFGGDIEVAGDHEAIGRRVRTSEI